MMNVVYDNDDYIHMDKIGQGTPCTTVHGSPGFLIIPLPFIFFSSLYFFFINKFSYSKSPMSRMLSTRHFYFPCLAPIN